MPIPIVFGTEHEYVIYVSPQADGSIHEKWDYERACAIKLLEHFHAKFFPQLSHEFDFSRRTIAHPAEQPDPRGRVLPQDEDSPYYYDSPGSASRATPTQMPPTDFYVGFMTPLGGRFYLDHGYFEGSSPECNDPFILLACELAQEELLVEAFEELFADDPRKPRLYKNVSDGQGHSQAAHRNFCISKDLWPRLVSCRTRGFLSRFGMFDLTRETKLLITWHVLEALFIGAGKVGIEHRLGYRTPSEKEERALRSCFQISGRADFFEKLVSEETTGNRPIVNQRREPLADPEKYGRYHCISGDANRAHWSNLFRIGLTAIILGMIEDDALNIDFYIADPPESARALSLDLTCKKPIEIITFSQGRKMAGSPIDILKIFMREIECYLASRPVPGWTSLIFEKAQWVLWALEKNPALLEKTLDWKIKERFIRGRPNAFNLHLNYHALASPVKLYDRLVANDEIETVIERSAIEKYKKGPPHTTRAYFRGHFMKHFYRELDFFLTDWEDIVFWTSGAPRRIAMADPAGLTKKDWGAIFESEESPRPEAFERLITDYILHKILPGGTDDRERAGEEET